MKHYNSDCGACNANRQREHAKREKRYNKSLEKNESAIDMIVSECRDEEIRNLVKHIQKYGIDL
jgi:hypothetical protein